MKYISAILVFLSLNIGIDNHDPSNFFSDNSLEVVNFNEGYNFQKDPTYLETSDWILSKLKKYAKGYDREHYRNSEFNDYYPNVKMHYDSFKIQYGKIHVTETYKYYGADLSKENNYQGYIIRQNTKEIPINDIISMNLNNIKSYFCILGFETKQSTVKTTRNLIRLPDGYNLDIPKPIIEYTKKGGVYFNCETEPEFDKRFRKALKHLKKLNLKRYPEKKETF